MVSDELKSHPLPDEFPEQIQELLSRTRTLDIEGHPVREAWEAFRSCFSDFEVVDFAEVIERSASHLPPDAMSRVAYDVDRERILRTDLTDELIGFWLAKGGGPRKLITTGRTFRRGTSTQKHANVFHQAEVFWLAEGLDHARAVEEAKRVAAVVVGAADIRIDPESVPVGAGVMARVLSGRWGDTWAEFAVSGMHSADTVQRGGLDPERFGAICIAFGLDRCALIRHGIDDISKLWAPPYVPG